MKRFDQVAWCLVAPCALIQCVAQEAAAQTPAITPLPVAAAVSTLSFALFSPVQLSPDGQLVAYTLVDQRRVSVELDARYQNIRRSGAQRFGLGGDIWVADTRGGHARNLTTSVGNNWYATWSPDGRLLAFLSDRSGRARLWTWNRTTNQLRQLSRETIRAESGLDWPIWSPDGRTILVKVLAPNLTIDAAASMSGAAVSPAAGTTTAVAYRSPQAARQFGANSPRDTALGYSAVPRPPTADLAAVDVATGRIRRLSHGVTVTRYAIAPSGHAVAYASGKPNLSASSQLPVVDITVAPLASGTPRVLASNVTFDLNTSSISWSPDGTRLAFPTGDAVVVVPLNGGVPTRIVLRDTSARRGAGGARPRVADLTPLWNEAGDVITMVYHDTLWKIDAGVGSARPFVSNHSIRNIVRRLGASTFATPDSGRSMLIVGRDTLTLAEEVVSVDVATGRTRVLKSSLEHYGGNAFWAAFDAAADGRRFAFIREDAKHAPDIWTTDASFESAARATHVNPIFDRHAMGSARVISWTGAGNTTLHGALLLPPTYRDGERLPLVLVVYGGSYYSGSITEFGLGVGAPTENMQLLATRGIAVLKPDLPLDVGNPMRDIATAIAAAAARAVELGYADSTRIGVMGHSYGGYSTLSAIVSSPTYAAAVESAGPANLTSMYGSFDDDGRNFGLGWLEEGQGGMRGTLWQQRDRYIENSPLFHLDKVATPLLIIHGTRDATTPPSETGQVFVGLRRLGKVVEYARYAGEGHWEGTWSAENQIDYWDRVIRWFDTYLNPR